MTKWADLARKKIPETPRQTTAVTAEALTTAALAVVRPGESEISATNERRIRDWLTFIGETGPKLIAETLSRCKTDPEALAYFLWRSSEACE